MYHCLAWFIKREFCIQATQLFPCSIHNENRSSWSSCWLCQWKEEEKGTCIYVKEELWRWMKMVKEVLVEGSCVTRTNHFLCVLDSLPRQVSSLFPRVVSRSWSIFVELLSISVQGKRRLMMSVSENDSFVFPSTDEAGYRWVFQGCKWRDN